MDSVICNDCNWTGNGLHVVLKYGGSCPNCGNQSFKVTDEFKDIEEFARKLKIKDHKDIE